MPLLNSSYLHKRSNNSNIITGNHILSDAQYLCVTYALKNQGEFVMCKNTNVSKTEWGFVARCKHCRYYHVAFGTTILKFSEEQFLDFADNVLVEKKAFSDISNRTSKMITIETENKNMCLIYSYNEVERLCVLLIEAGDVILKERLLNFSLN